jgi:hypothetical protein
MGREIVREGDVGTYKKNLVSPLTTAWRRASLSSGVLGMGLQKAWGLTRLMSPVRKRWWAVMVAGKGQTC